MHDYYKILYEDDALNFEKQLQSITGRRGKLSWRYRWPSNIREEVLTRLLALNVNHYEEEVAKGMHSKKSKEAKSLLKTKEQSSSNNESNADQIQMGLLLP